MFNSCGAAYQRSSVPGGGGMRERKQGRARHDLVPAAVLEQDRARPGAGDPAERIDLRQHPAHPPPQRRRRLRDVRRHRGGAPGHQREGADIRLEAREHGPDACPEAQPGDPDPGRIYPGQAPQQLQRPPRGEEQRGYSRDYRTRATG
jgi:hypothetical protein